MTASRLLAAGVAALGLVAGGVLVLGGGSGMAAPAPFAGCSVLRVSALGDHGLSTVYRVELGSGRMTRLRTLDRRVDALGFHRGQGVAYGLAGHGARGAYHRVRVVRLSVDGALTDVGAVRGPKNLTGASAGAVAGNLLYVRDGRELHSVDINPRSAGYLSVVRSVRLWPSELARTVDDFDYRPADGLLYGVTTHVSYYGRVVRIDPRTGRVGHVDGPRLPGGRPYGSAAFGPDGALYAASNRSKDHDWYHQETPARSRLMRVELRPGAVPVEVAVWPVASHSDMTGCLSVPPPPTTTPPPPTTVPPPTTPRPPTTPPTPTPTVTGPPGVDPPGVDPPGVVPPGNEPPGMVPPGVGPPGVVPPGPPVDLPPGATSPAGPPGAPNPVSPTIPPVPPQNPAPQQVSQGKRPTSSASGTSSTEKKRRWGLVALVLIIGGSAAATGARRHR